VRRVLRRRPEAAGRVEVVVTGMGLRASASAASEWAPRARAVVVCGVAGGTGGVARRGDVVVASRLVDGAGAELPAVVGAEVAGGMAATVASVGEVRDEPAARAALVALGAAAVETEAAGWAPACAAAGVPLVVIRGVLDTPEQPLGAAAGLVAMGARGPGAAALARLAVRPGAWPALMRLGRQAGEVERAAAEVAVRAAIALAGR